MEDINVCALGFGGSSPTYQVFGRVYEADGTTRRALLAENLHWVHDDLPNGMKAIPLNVQLEACQDYEIAFDLPAESGFVLYDEAEFDLPYDVGGTIRVNDGAESGPPASILSILNMDCGAVEHVLYSLRCDQGNRHRHRRDVH